MPKRLRSDGADSDGDADADADLRARACAPRYVPPARDARAHAEGDARRPPALRQLGGRQSSVSERRPLKRHRALRRCGAGRAGGRARARRGGRRRARWRRFRGKPAPRVEAAPDGPRRGRLRLELPSGWAAAPVDAARLQHRPLWLRDAPAGARAAVELLPAASPTLLPVGLQASGRPRRGELGQGRVALPDRDAHAVPGLVYVAPTTKGIATVGCLGCRRLAERACHTLASALTVPGARQLEPGQRPPSSSGCRPCRPRRGPREGQRALDAAPAPAQAAAADGLARAHRTAAAELAPLRSGDDVPRARPSATSGRLRARTARSRTQRAPASRSRTPTRARRPERRPWAPQHDRARRDGGRCGEQPSRNRSRRQRSRRARPPPRPAQHARRHAGEHARRDPGDTPPHLRHAEHAGRHAGQHALREADRQVQEHARGDAGANADRQEARVHRQVSRQDGHGRREQAARHREAAGLQARRAPT